MFTSKQVGVGKGRTTFRLFSFLLSLAVIWVLAALPVSTVLVIRDTESNRIVWSGPVRDGSPFAIRWTHSIHRSPVIEYYRVQNKQLRLYAMQFEDYGIGMSSELAPGEKLVSRDGAFLIENMNRLFPAIRLFIGQVRANHTLLFEGTEIPLASVNTPGKAVLIQAETHSILQMIGGY